MTFVLPPKLLGCYMIERAIHEYWGASAGDGAGTVKSWEVTISVNPQMHGSTLTTRSGQYDARDILPGDYVTTNGGAVCYKIKEILEVVSYNEILCIAEDEDRLNGLMNNNQFNDGRMEDGEGIVFSLKHGFPALFPLPAILPSGFTRGFATQLSSRFSVRGKHDTYHVAQPGHNFNVGQAVALQATGLLTPIDFTDLGDVNSKQFFGVVEEVGHPAEEYVRIRTVGPIIDVNLEEGSPGGIFYLDPESSNGQMAYSPPGTLANRQPVYIKINNLQSVFIASGLVTSEQATGTLGGKNYVFDTKQDMIDFRGRKTNGMTALVRDTGNPEGIGEWGYYVYDNTQGGWVNVSTFDSSVGDSRSIKVELTHTNTGENLIYRVSHDVRIVNVSIKVTQTFDGDASITVGDATVNDRFLTTDEADLHEIGTYYSFPDFLYNLQTEVAVNAYINQTGSTRGRCEVLITYV